MLFIKPPSTPNPEWRKIQAQNFRDWHALAHFLALDPASLQHIVIALRAFPLNVPKRLAEKIEKGTLSDPILRQFLPLQEEALSLDAFFDDPVGDTRAQKAPKLLHKYRGRALLVTTGACPMHCRFCFRQHFDYAANKGFEEELRLIEEDPTLSEIILSGGDPLSLGDDALEHLLVRLARIPHLKRVRWHTRFPVGIPERITEGFLALLNESRLQSIFVVHCNHPKELDEDVFAALKCVHCCGVPVLTQTVLLAGVNDDAEVLKRLFLSLADRGIIPYYLHQLDRVQGAQRFEVPIGRGHRLMEVLRACLPGYALPSYVREVAGEVSKINIIIP